MTLFAVIRSALAITAVLLAGAFRPEATETGAVASEWPTAGWRTSTPEEQGMDSVALTDLVDFGASHQLESLLVARHGVIVVEAFYAPFPAGVKHRTNSVTKPGIGALVAIALEERRLESPDQRAVDFFPDRLIANLDDRKKAITIQNLLDMRSGLDWTEPLTDEPPRSMFAMERSANWAQFVLDQPMAANPGATFLYDSGNSHLLSAILTQATGESALDYVQKRLFGLWGSPTFSGATIRRAFRSAVYGLFLQPRDMA